MKSIGLILVVLLTSCASDSRNLKPTEVTVTRYVNYECGVPPAITPLTLRPVQFTVLSPKDVGEFLLSANLAPNDVKIMVDYVFSHGGAWVALTAKGYENLSKNTADILAGVKQLQAREAFLEACISDSKTTTP